jgi:hypothetical protein
MFIEDTPEIVVDEVALRRATPPGDAGHFLIFGDSSPSAKCWEYNDLTRQCEELSAKTLLLHSRLFWKATGSKINRSTTR